MQQQQTGGVFPIPFTSANSGISYPIGLFNGSGINLPNGTNVSSNHNSLLHFPQGTVQVKPEPPEELHTSIINDGHTVMVNNTGYSTSPRPSPFVSGKYNVRGATTATPPMTTGGSYRNSPVPAGLQAPPMNTYANLTVVQPSQQQESLANSESCGDDSSDDDDGGDGDSRSVSSTSGSPYFGRSSALKREFCELTDVGHPLPPEVQEALKLERKRARNRLAATKCRARKIQRIEQLEGEVNAVKSRNASLASKAELLRNQVAELRRLLAAHHSQGCKVPLDVGGGSR